MKYLIVILILLTGCSAEFKPTPELEKQIQQNSFTIDAIMKYIEDCQAKGICPKPEVEE